MGRETGAMGRALREAVVTMLAVLATLACSVAVDAEPGPAVLAVVLCVSLSRSHMDRDLRGRFEAAVALPLVGLVATGVGFLLLRLPWVGAALFVAGMATSVWLRRFGSVARHAGGLIALPFVAILTTPYVPTRHAGHWLAVLIPIVVALLALLWVSVFHALAYRFRLLPRLREPHAHPAPALAKPSSTLRPDATTRMAIQMAVALGAAFLVGHVVFAHRWAWVVLTAFIVNSGTRGRLDVAYKSVLRVLGAGLGTLLALGAALHTGAHDGSTVVLMLAAVFLGLWLRPLGYAWWALFVTIALALLQGFEGGSAGEVLMLRLQEIVVGALLGVAAAWFVWPVRSTEVLRRRLADALATMAAAFDPATPARTPGELAAAMHQIEQLAPAFRASRLATASLRPLQPADWIDALVACYTPACVLITHERAPAEIRRAIGTARKSLREPDHLLGALQTLHTTLVNAARHETPAERRDPTKASARSADATRSG